MIVANAKDVEGKKYAGEGANNVLRKVLISAEEGWQDYVMRLFEIDQGGNSSKHSHDWPHIVYVVGGKGIIHLDGVDYQVEAGSFSYIPGGKIHQLLNNGEEKFSFICIVPPEGN